MPALDTTAAAAVAGDIAVAWIVWLDVVGDPVRVTSGGANITFTGTGDSDLDGNTFTAFAGQFLDIGDVTNADTGSETLSVTLSGIQSLNTALLNAIGTPADWQGRACRIWFQLYDPTGQTAKGGIVSHYTGYMSSVTINPSPTTQTITLTVENYLAAFNNASNRDYLNQSQYDSTDLSAQATISSANGSVRGGVGVSNLPAASGNGPAQAAHDGGPNYSAGGAPSNQGTTLATIKSPEVNVGYN